MSKEYDKLFKLVALVFINAIMRISGIEPGIVEIVYPEVFSQETDRGIMDFCVLTRRGYYIIFEFHSTSLSEKILLRNFQYLANLRVRVKHPVDMQILSTDKTKGGIREVEIFPGWNFKPVITFLIDFDGDKILSNIKNKLKNNIELTDTDAYLFTIIPFTNYERDTVDLIVELCHFVNENEISQEFKYIIKLSQILWVNALIDDLKLKDELLDVIKMKSNFIQEYERNLVESAAESAFESGREENSLEIARKMKEKNFTRDVILDITGVDILMI